MKNSEAFVWMCNLRKHFRWANQETKTSTATYVCRWWCCQQHPPHLTLSWWSVSASVLLLQRKIGGRICNDTCFFFIIIPPHVFTLVTCFPLYQKPPAYRTIRNIIPKWVCNGFAAFLLCITFLGCYVRPAEAERVWWTSWWKMVKMMPLLKNKRRLMIMWRWWWLCICFVYTVVMVTREGDRKWVKIPETFPFPFPQVTSQSDRKVLLCSHYYVMYM